MEKMKLFKKDKFNRIILYYTFAQNYIQFPLPIIGFKKLNIKGLIEKINKWKCKIFDIYNNILKNFKIISYFMFQQINIGNYKFFFRKN